MKSLGIDLAGKEEKPTGICLWDGKRFCKKLVYKDEEIIEFVRKENPDIIAIDSPLSMPQGKWRKSDLLLKKEGFPCLSPRFPGMLALSKRGIRIANKLRRNGYKVIEVFPRATQKILGISGKKSHEFDAELCAITGMYYLQGKYKTLGKIVIPRNI